MKRTMHTAAALLTLCLAQPVLAQTFIVDAAGGPGVSFTSIAAATAAVPDGSTLLVRPGTYGAFTIDGKGIAVLGSPGTQLLGGQVQVRNTTATQSVVLRDLSAPVGQIDCADCAGPILLDHVKRPLGPLAPFTLTFTNCDQVFATECNLMGLLFGTNPDLPGIACTDSSLVLSNCDVRSSGSRCLVATTSDIQIESAHFAPLFTSSNVTPTIDMDANTELRLLGSTLIGASQNPPFVGGHVRMGPNVTFAGSPTASQPTSLTQVPDEIVAVAGGGLAASVSATLVGDPTSLGLLLIGETATPFLLPGVADTWWLDPIASDGVALGLMSAPIQATIVIPATPTLQGLMLGFQGIYFHAANGWSASAPARFVIY